MQEIVSLLASPVFWFGSIFVALLVNLLSTYAYPQLAARVALMSGKSTIRRLLISASFDADLDRLVVNPSVLAFELVCDRRDRDAIFTIMLMLVTMFLGFFSGALVLVWWVTVPMIVFAGVFVLQLLFRIRKIVDRKILFDAYIERSVKTN